MLLSKKLIDLFVTLTLFKIGLFGDGHTYPSMMKPSTVIPYLKKSRKYINHMIQHLSSADIKIFTPESTTFVILRNTNIDYILIHNF